MVVGMLGRKVGMTQIFDPTGQVIPVTVIQAGPCSVLQVKKGEAADGYDAVQLGFEDLKPLAQAAPLQLEKKGFVPMNGLDWKAPPLVMWMHQAQAKPGATVELTAGGQPALVTWEYGKGRVAALSATVLGEPPAGGMAFWDWPDWPNCMERVARWLLPRK